jgi:peptide/nickel transport system permease protein
VFIYVARRALYSLPVLIIATFLVFVMVSATFDPTAKLAQSRDAAHARAAMREELGLDRPLLVQYGTWLGDAAHGDFGTSYRTRTAVSEQVRPAFWNTFQLIIWGIIISTTVALFVGVYSATRQYSPGDYLLTGLAFVGIAMPPFWFGLIAYDFATKLADWFNNGQPVLYGLGLHSAGKSGINGDYALHLVLPVLTLTIQIIASWSRYERASMLEVMSSDYIRTARAKGLGRRTVVYKHALRNALIPFVTVMALDIGALFGGLVVTEQIFSIPGMGRLFVQALVSGDAPVVLTWLLISAVFIIIFNLLADLAYSALDPRIRLA